ncbi:hypothetical protein PIB30_066820 [Stylosanthes scabra]|uniref:Uncharacterized protein n=1 Tax=Stylosanthes scabra TaxID=79078 RepID=A0ABU6UL67_9FABA|nr:hypothetical protein [Stylosanthes scabra]
MEHALLIFVLMTEGIVNLPMIMRDVMLKQPSENSRNLLLYPMFIVRLADHYQVPEFAGNEIVKIYRRSSPEPSLKDIMRYLHRQERVQRNK